MAPIFTNNKRLLSNSGAYDVIIVGAGLQGCATALNLVQRKHRVLLLEKNTAGRGASGVNAGGVRRLNRAPAEIPLSLAAMEMWHRIEKIVDHSCGFRPNGQIRIAENDADMRKLEARAKLVQRLGYAHEELIDAKEMRRLVPAAAGHCVGALVSRRDGFAEPYWTTRAFCAKAVQLGATLMEHSPVTAIERKHLLWRVRCGEIVYEAPIVVNSAGAWGDRIAAMIGDTIPLLAEAPTMMVTQRVSHFLDPVVGLAGRKLSFKQMPNGSVVIGGGLRSHLDMATERTIIDFKELMVSAQTVIDVFPLMQFVPVVRCWAGIEGIVPDEIPVIGPSPAAPGFFHAFGFSAHGFQLGPIVGNIMADLITEGRTEFPIEPFRADRFTSE
jgi:sarcosine oxidase subunit beta